MPAPLDPALLSIPLIAHPHLRHSSDDAQAWAEAVTLSTPVRICEPLKPRLPFHIDHAVVDLGRLLMVATQGSPITLSTDLHHSAQLLIPYRGNGFWRLEGSVHANPVGESVLYLPQAPLHLENDITSGVSLNVSPTDLINTALTMAGPAGLAADRLTVFAQPTRLLLADRGSAALIRGIYGILQTIDQLCRSADSAIALLRFDDQLIRMTVMLLLPELRSAAIARHDPPESVSASRRLQPLLDWIDANLDQPIGLSDLERQLHMSRRNLQYIFRRVCGCTPTQWVRTRRLSRAMGRLRTPLPGDSVASIGRSFGFGSPVAFSRDFRRQFGCTPSSVLRS